MLPRVTLALLLQLGDEVPAGPLQGRVAEGIIVVAHSVSLRGLDGVSVLDEGLVEGVIPGLNELGAELLRWHPVDARRVLGADRAVVGVGVLLTPEAVQAGGDEANARVPVVPVAEGSDEAQELLLDLRVVVVGGEGDPLVVVEVVGVVSGDDVLHGEGCPFERVGQGVCDRSGRAPVLGRPRHEALHRVRDRGGCVFQVGPLGCGGRRGRGRQGGTHQSCGRRESDGDASTCSHREGPLSHKCCGWGQVRRGRVAWSLRVRRCSDVRVRTPQLSSELCCHQCVQYYGKVCR